MKNIRILSTLIFLLFSMCKSQEKTAINIEEIRSYIFNEETHEFERQSNIVFSEEIHYDKNKKINEKFVIYNDEKTDKYDKVLVEKYKYNDGNLIKKERFDFRGNKVEEIEYLLNKNGKPERINVNTFDNNGKLLLKNNHSFYILIEYSRNGEKRSTYEYDENAKDYKLSFSSIMTFNNNDLIVEEKLIDNKNEPYQIENITYDKYNNPVKKIQTLRFPCEITQKFNSKNDVIEYIYRAEDNFISKSIYDYKYDDNNNWIEKTETNEKEKILTKRKLTYY